MANPFEFIQQVRAEAPAAPRGRHKEEGNVHAARGPRRAHREPHGANNRPLGAAIKARRRKGSAKETREEILDEVAV
jgi:hypothetical protein